VKGLKCRNCERLRRIIQQLRAENSELREENSMLKRRLRLYENPNTPPSRRRYPRRRSSTRSGRYPGRPKGYPGRTRPRPRPEVVKPPPMKERCERCGSPLGEPCYVNHHLVEEISNPSPKRVIDFLEFRWECIVCGAETVSRHPDCPPNGRFGRNVYVQTTLMKYELRLPLRKVQAALERQGLKVTPSTVLEILRRTAVWLRPEYERILQRIRDADVVYTDETGLKVDGKKHWIWTFTTRNETLIAVRRSRGKKVLKEILGRRFRGVIVCDGWRSYSSFTSRIQRCWAHLLREAEYLSESVEEAKPLSQALHELYRRINIPPGDKPPPEEAARLVEEAKAEMLRLTRGPYRSEEVSKFAVKIRNGIDHWFTFLTTPGVEPTNNRAERALREHVVQRKIMGTLRNEKGTFIHETIMTVLATWKQRGLNPSETLSTALSLKWQNS
jgi:transposase-like protein